jgi:hypothetical protein
MKQVKSTDPVASDRQADGPARAARSASARLGRTWIPALVLLLGACGGGGGGGTAATPAAAAADPASTVALTGVATYDSVPSTAAGLAYSATVAKPIRGASVDIVNGAGTVLASTQTDARGAYSALVPPNSAVSVRVKAQTPSSSGADVSVRDNTSGDGVYALQTPVFQVGTGAAVRNIAAPSGWTGTGYGSDRAAAPFAILDTIYTTQAKLLSAAPSTTFPALRVFWSPNNRPTAGNPQVGDIGGTAFVATASGLAIYVVGRENVDTDEYDASVIAHEWGHYYQAAFSRDDSPGGSHSFGDRLDHRVAFSEGWGNAWSGIALERDDYIDTYGPQQGRAGRLALTGGDTSNAGWYREDSIQSVLWNLNRQVGFKPMHDTFSGPFRRGAAVTSIHSFAAAFSTASPANAPVLAALLTAQNIKATAGDPYGTSETNSGDIASALPIYRSATVGPSMPVCVSYAAGVGNRLGNFAYLRFTAPTARTYAINVGGGTGTNPDFAVWGNGVGLAAVAAQSGTAEAGSVSLPAGDAVIALHDNNNTTASPCFNVTIQ